MSEHKLRLFKEKYNSRSRIIKFTMFDIHSELTQWSKQLANTTHREEKDHTYVIEHREIELVHN